MAYQSDNFANTNKFSVDLTKWISKQTTNVLAKVKKVVISIHNDVIILTPVDTGRARSNWNVAIGAPDPTITEPPGSGARGSGLHRDLMTGVTFDPSSKAQDNQQILSALKLPDVIFISNSVPYIGYLEYGTDHMEPHHMVMQALQNAQAMIESS